MIARILSRFRVPRVPLASLVLGVFLPGLLGCQDRSTDGGTTDGTSTVAFYLPDGKPAAGARVQIFASSDTMRTPRIQAFTDANGEVKLPVLDSNFYNLVARDKSGRAMFQDSLLSDGKSMDYASDTLVSTGVVTGRVRVQPQHDPRIVWIALLGAGTYLNVDDSGRFRIEGVPEGKFTLAGFTKTEGYTTTFKALRVKRDSTSDIGTLDMTFTGLPVVKNLEARFDTLEGLVHLRWDSIPLRETWRYTVLRDGIEVGETSGALWIDTVSDEYPADVPSQGRHAYRVVVSDAERPGPAWETIEMRIISAYLYEEVKVDWVRKSALPWTGGVFEMDTLDGALIAWRSAEFGSKGKGLGGSEASPVWTIDGIERWTSQDSGATWSKDPTVFPGVALPVRFGGKWWSLVAGAASLDSMATLPGLRYPVASAWVRLRDSFHVVSSSDGRTWDTVSTLVSTVPVADVRIERDASKLWVIGSGQESVSITPVWIDLVHWTSETGTGWNQVVVDNETIYRSPFPIHMHGVPVIPVNRWTWWAGRWWDANWTIGGIGKGWYLDGLYVLPVATSWPEWTALQRFSGPTAVLLSPERSAFFFPLGEAVSLDSSGARVHTLSWPGGGFHRELLWGGRILSISDSGVYLGRILSGLEGGDPRGTWVKKTETPRAF